MLQTPGVSRHCSCKGSGAPKFSKFHSSISPFLSLVTLGNGRYRRMDLRATSMAARPESIGCGIFSMSLAFRLASSTWPDRSNDEEFEANPSMSEHPPYLTSRTRCFIHCFIQATDTRPQVGRLGHRLLIYPCTACMVAMGMFRSRHYLHLHGLRGLKDHSRG
jgi:hypothetical protein